MDHKRGFTLVEIVIIMGIVGILIATTSTTLFRSQQRAALDTTVEQLVSDIKRQQLLAQTGGIETAGNYIDYSVRFETDKYILFPGSVYDSGSSANFTIDVPGPIAIVSASSPQTITFGRLSGDVRTYSSASATIVVQNTQTGSQKMIWFNRRGAPTVSP